MGIEDVVRALGRVGEAVTNPGGFGASLVPPSVAQPMVEGWLAPFRKGQQALSGNPSAIGLYANDQQPEQFPGYEVGGADPSVLIPWSVEMASNVEAGAGLVPKKPNTVGMFGGKLSVTADQAALARAEQMAAKGADRNAIWKETGWFQGADAKWRYEIPDDTSQLTPPIPKGGATLDQALSHPDLYAAYPEAASINVNPGVVGDRTMRGAYQSGGEGSPPTITMPLGSRADRGVVLHEATHGVQDIEGFARGGNTMSLWGHSDPAVRKAVNDEWARLLAPIGKEEFTKGYSSGWSPSRAEVDKAYADYVKGTKKARGNVYDIANKAAQETAATNVYRRLAGEVEARNVQTRMDMTPEQRLAKPPWETQEFPEDQQIIRGGMGMQEAQMSAAPVRTGGELSTISYRVPPDEMSRMVIPGSTPMLPSRIVSPEELYRQNSTLIPFVGDRTDAGVTLTGVNETPLASPVPLLGGGEFPRIAKPSVFASGKAPVTRMISHAKNVGKEGPVHLVHTALGGRNADFTTMMSDAVLGLVPSAKISQKAMKAFNNEMKGKMKGWPGLEKLKTDWLGTGDRRKVFVETMAKGAYQDAGFPDIPSIRSAITNTELLGVPTGTSGLSVSRLDLNNPLVSEPSLIHPSYPMNVGGEYEGRFRNLTTREQMFPDFYAHIRANGADPVDYDYLFRNLNVSQPANQQWLDQMMGLQERR